MLFLVEMAAIIRLVVGESISELRSGYEVGSQNIKRGTKQAPRYGFRGLDADAAVELAFWNQGAKKLFLAEIPTDPKSAASWHYDEINSWNTGLEHEDLYLAD
jgi:hypothetical protein